MPWMPSANKGICKGFKGLGLKVESFIVAKQEAAGEIQNSPSPSSPS